MAAESDFIKCQSALGMHISQRADAIDDETIILYRCLEALQTIPCHVLDCDPRTIGNENKIGETMHNDCAFTLLDDGGQYGDGRRKAGVTVREHIDVRAFHPGDVGRSMYGLFYIFAIEVKR